MKEVKQKERIIHNSIEELKDKVGNIQKTIFQTIMDFLMNFAEGKPTQKQLLSINKALKKVISKDTFRSPVINYLKNFDKVEELQKKIVGKEIGEDLMMMNLIAEKKLATEEIINGLLNDKMVDANLRSPLRKIIYRYSTTNISMRQAKKELEDFILSNKSGAGFAERYVHILATESLSRFDGMINQRIMNDYGLDGFRIVGSLIKTSQPQCIQMVTGKGELGALKINGKYASSDIPVIVAKLKEHYPGVNKYISPSNYFIYRNHWGCRHTFIPTMLLKQDISELKNRALINPRLH